MSALHPSNVAGTLGQKGIADWLLWAERETEYVERLTRLSCGRKKGADADAIWAGRCALSRELERSILSLRDRGGLLFFGQKNAVGDALAIKRGGAA